MSCKVILCTLLLAATMPCAIGVPVDHPPPGYHDVVIGSGDHKSLIRVHDSAKPMADDGSSSDSGRYNPENMNLDKSDPMANKAFNTGFASLSKNDTADEARNSRQFATHSFATGAYEQSGRKFQTVAYNESSRSSDDFRKTYTLPSTNADANRSFDIKASEYQGKTAPEAQLAPKADPFATPSSLSEKTFFDPNLKHVKHDPYAAGLDVKSLTDLPNRPLTIKEVRNLINHDQAPDLDKPAEEEDDSDKPLNDPGWEPPTVAPPARSLDQMRYLLSHESIPTAPPAETEKDGDLPSPGEMAQPPENSESLPK